jgi:hypothetical protein
VLHPCKSSTGLGTSFLGMFRLIEYTHLCLSWKEGAVHAGHKVLVDVDGNILLTVGDPEVILDQQLRPHPIHL